MQVLNCNDSLPVAANGSFSLPTSVASGGTYNVSVGTSTTQTCGVQNGAGTVASANVTAVVVYCSYNVTAATLKATFTSVGVGFTSVYEGVNYPFDYVSADTFHGVSTLSSLFTVNSAGTIVPNETSTSTYAVTTTNGIPSYTDKVP